MARTDPTADTETAAPSHELGEPGHVVTCVPRSDPDTLEALAIGTDATETATHSRLAWPRATVNPTIEEGARYVFGEVFAAGGLGVVRRAEDRRLGRVVAVKELLRDSPAAQRRFALEAAITARLQHPAIVPLYDLGWRDSGEPFYCMKLVEGENLDTKIRATRTISDRLRLLEHVIAVADAIAYAHDQQIIHRDLKPANVLVGRFGETVVIDWGLAKDVSGQIVFEAPEAPEQPVVGPGHLTAIGAVMGTLRYMAPEQARGERVDARSDIYSLGAMLYHVLAGQPPFADGAGPHVLVRVTHGDVADVRTLDPRIPRELADVVHRALAHHPADRYGSAQEFAEDLRRFRTGNLVSAHDYSLAEMIRLWARRHRAILAAAALLLVGLSLAVVVAFLQITQERDTAERAREEARSHLARAGAAEREKTSQLWHALLSQARASQRTQQPGQRYSSLVALREAAALLPASELGEERRLALRNAAIVGLSLADARPRKRWNAHTVGGFMPVFDTAFSVYANSDPLGTTTLRRIADDHEVLRIPHADRAPWYVQLSFYPGDRFLSVHYYENDYYTRDNRDGTHLYDLSRGTSGEVQRLHKSMVSFEQDGRHAWIAVGDGEVQRLDTDTWTPVRRLGVRLPPARYSDLHVQAEGRYLAANDEVHESWDIVDLATEEIAVTIPTTFDPPAAWGREAIFAIGELGRVVLWDIDAGERLAELGGYTSKIVNTVFHSDGRTLGTCSWDGSSRFWDVASRRELLRIEGCLVRFDGEGQAIGLQRFENAEAWDFVLGEAHRSFPGWARSVEFSPDGRSLLIAGERGVELWDVQAQRRIQRITQDRCDSAIFGPEAVGVLAYCHDSGLRGWPWRADRSGLAAPRHLKAPAPTADPGQLVVWAGHTAAIAAADQRGVALFDPTTLELRARLSSEFPVRHLAMSPDGRWLVSGSRWNPAMEIFDVLGEHAPHSLSCGSWDTAHASFSPDGHWLAVDTHDRHELLRVGTWESVRSAPSGHQEGSRPLVFSPDGRMLAVSATPTEIHLLRASDLSLVAALPQPTRDLWSLRFSPDGALLAAASGEHGVYVWSIPELRAHLAALKLDWDSPDVL